MSAPRRSDDPSPGLTYHRSELFHGTVERSFELPASVDSTKTEASYENGVLAITLPKRQEAQPRLIEVKAGS